MDSKKGGTEQAAEIEINQAENTSSEKTKKEPKEKKSKQDCSQQIAELENRISELDDMYNRLRAEYANYKRRTEQEKEQLGSYIKGETFKALFPAFDSLEKAIDAASSVSDNADNFKIGIENIFRQINEILAGQGLTAFGNPGDKFDPEYHNAVVREDADGDIEPETVTEIYQRGYSVDNRVIRPAMVKVAN